MTQWLRQFCGQSALLAILVLLYGAAIVFLQKRYAARWFYLVGVILLLGFLIPFRPVLTLTPQQLPAFAQAIVGHGAPPPGHTAPAAQTPPATQAAFDKAALALWLTGALGALLYHGIRHRRFLRAIKRWSAPVEDPATLAQFEAAKRALSLQRRQIGFARCACVTSPMLLWLGKPTVLLPESTMAQGDLHCILLHELCHCKRRDLLCRLLMLLCTAMHWFNPAIYLLTRLVTQQCEISCDEYVVQRQTPEIRHRYALSMIGVVRQQARGYSLLTTNFCGGKDTMKKRIASIYAPSNRKMSALLLTCILLITMLAGTSIAADPPAAEDITLPDAPIALNETVDSYIVSWAPVEGATEYHLGAYFQVDTDLHTGVWIVAGGWTGPRFFTDGSGTAYAVENGVWDSILLDGDATEADISALINFHTDPKNLAEGTGTIEALKVFRLVLVAVREAGAPVYRSVDIPLA